MKTNVKNNPKEDKKWFECNYNECIFKTKLKSNLKRHINSVHKKLKEFKCFRA
jgi:hypothetical protein